jgi:hypothetical protein
MLLFGGVGLQDTGYYMSLPFDVSGSLSKNRFRVELLWGVSKMLDIYDYDDFIMVFDYVCDIEVHSNTGYEFYQLKSHKGEKSYSINEIIKMKSGSSILGKLYALKQLNNLQNVKLALVSNSYLKDGKKVFTDMEEIDLGSISLEGKKTITESLKTELSKSDIDFSNMYYIFTSMNLNAPTHDVIGKIVTSFVKIKGCEAKKPTALYRLIYDTVSGKACCELVQKDYDQLVKNKGITKAELDSLLNCHLERADNSVELTRKYIDQIEDFKRRRDMKVALAKLITYLQTSKELQAKQKDIAAYLIANCEQLPNDFEQCIDELLCRFGTIFSPEYSKFEIYIFMVLILKRFEEGVYDE